ncbi:MAG TPA: CoA ester lyase [Rhodospirillales bacterium]|nr:CoA ester lyase [Rhodospirillales bacterium]
MATTARPRRSVLYMPGSSARALDKARGLPADGLILDLEDAVTPDAKDTARDQVVAALAQGGYGGRELIVRINGLDTPWGDDDIAAIAPTGAHAILLPKINNAAMVADAEKRMVDGGASAGMAIWSMMETPLAILHAEEIAFSSPRLAALVMGTSDLAKDLHAAHTKERLPLLGSLNMCLLAARAAALAILDGVYLDLADSDGFRYSCEQGQQMGFDGKTLIHPKTIDAANSAFAPSDAEVAWSRKIIAAHAAAENEGQGVLLVDGKLIENLHVESAKRSVQLSEAISDLQGAA